MSQMRLILIAAPSGGGKNSFMVRALEDFPQLVDVITYTTREMRFGEQQGNPYHFISQEDFQEKVQQNFFVEWAQVHDAQYGTSHQSLKEAWGRGQIAIMDIDVQGVRKLSKVYGDAVSFFILPPSIEELKKRILAVSYTHLTLPTNGLV